MPPKTIKQKREARQAVKIETRKKTTDPIDKVINQINQQLGGQGYVFRGSEIEAEQYERRSSGIPTIDFILNGGLPKPGLIEIGGEYSSGKTTLSLHFCAHEQRTNGGAVGWVALESFSKRWARENGFFVPFSEDHEDPFEDATELELHRMQEAGITDPYTEVSPFVLVQDERGDAALDAAITMLKSNQFAIIVVDSLGIAKSTKWLEETEVQDAGDFPREPKMIGDYTARALLSLNARYDENGVKAKDGKNRLQTTLIHINQIGTAVGTMAKAPWNKQRMKGGEGNKHNHHGIIFLWKGQPYSVKVEGGNRYVYAVETNAICIKSKLGPPFMEGTFDLYFQDYGTFRKGDIDLSKDVIRYGIMAGLIERNGAWYTIGEERLNGLEAVQEFVRNNPEWFDWLYSESISVLRKR